MGGQAGRTLARWTDDETTMPTHPKWIPEHVA